MLFRSSVSNIGSAIDKAGKTFGRALTKSIVGLLGVQMADTLVKSIDDAMRNPIFDGIGANIAYGIGEGFSQTLQSIPIAGTVGKWIAAGVGTMTDKIGLTSDASGTQAEKQQASRIEAERLQNMIAAQKKMTDDLQRQAELHNAIGDQERLREIGRAHV